MITCGGCGREIDAGGMGYGARLLCGRCYHLQVTGPEPPHILGSKAFTLMAAICLVLIALAGFALCILYLLGSGDFAWFLVLSSLMLIVVVSSAAVLVKRRNLSLIIAVLYLPLGLWAYLWYQAPGAGWEYGRMTAYGGFFFFALGLIAMGLFIRDVRALPRL
jgi:hypothetical protein